jgi:formylmethanofuran dehydrogenase subunit E
MSVESYLGDVDAHLEECGRLHGHICPEQRPEQLLGVRMALHRCATVGIKDPRGADRKSLMVCVGAVTGVTLGKRSLKYLNYGRMATKRVR